MVHADTGLCNEAGSNRSFSKECAGRRKIQYPNVEEWNSIEIGPVVRRVSDDPWVIISYVPKTPEHWPCVSAKDPIFLVPVVE
jgi:hypothetical protein